MKHFGDITKISGYDVPIVDVITGGSPCQDLSVAGKRAGLQGERSGLFMEQMRIVKEMRERDVRDNGRSGWAVRPRYMVWENVPGAFSSGNPKGSDFAAVIEEIIKVAEPGACVSVCVPDGGWTKSGCYYAADGSWSIAWRVHDAQFWGVPQRRKRISLIADFGGLSAPEVSFERKGLSGDSAESGTERKRTAAAFGSGPAYSIQGNTVDRAAKQNGLGVSEDVAHTLNAVDRHAVCYPDKVSTLPARMDGSPCIDRGPPVIAVYDARGNGDGVICPTITGDHNGSVSDYTALCVGNGQLHNISMATVANTLDTMHDQQAVLIWPEVRRLTPLECERLQGYPDGWTDIGEWTDTNGKKHKEADSQRYKALGNSIALPFWQFLARRICAQYERPVTMASLFDGIGGFPLVFERCGAKAVWASEIEEFPIAVTKIHFPEETK